MAEKIYSTTKLLVCLLTLSLFCTITGCARWTDVKETPGAKGFTPAKVETRVPAVLTEAEVIFKGENSGDGEGSDVNSDVNEDSGVSEDFPTLFLDKLRETDLFYPVTYSPGSKGTFSESNKGIEFSLLVETHIKSSIIGPLICSLLPITFEYESEMTLVAKRWDGSERTYIAKSKRKLNEQILSGILNPMPPEQYDDLLQKVENSSTNSLMYQLLQDAEWCLGK